LALTGFGSRYSIMNFDMTMSPGLSLLQEAAVIRFKLDLTQKVGFARASYSSGRFFLCAAVRSGAFS